MDKEIYSELRYDLASKDWVIIGNKRKSRPDDFKNSSKNKSHQKTKKGCYFCNSNIRNQKPATLVYVNGKNQTLDKPIIKDWTLIVVGNMYPAFEPHDDLHEVTRGKIYKKMRAVGYQEIVIPREHNKHIGLMKTEKVKEIIDAYQERYLDLMNKKHVNHIAIYHNHGPASGASIIHPHSQIITTPLIDNDLKITLQNTKKYHSKNKKCIYCEMMKWEKKVQERIVFENKDFLVICPFASKRAFQMIITPKKHGAYFERIKEKEKLNLAQALREALRKLNKGLDNPSYNFYLRTSPCDGKKYDYYHWHLTILPRTTIWAGFEAGSGMEISSILPEDATKFLRKQ